MGLLAVGLASALGAFLGFRQGIVRYRAAMLMGLAGMLTAPLGVLLAQHLPNRPLMGGVALVLIYSAWRMLNRPSLNDDHPDGVPC